MPDSDTASSEAPRTQTSPDANAGASFRDQLEYALESKRQQIADESLPALKDEFQKLQSTFKSFYNVLLQKALVSEDPYKYDQKISEVTIPEKTQILESEQSDEIGIRLSQYESQLEFLNNYYNFSIEYLTLKRIKLLAGLVKFIEWGALSETSSQPNTRVVAIMYGKIRGGTDNFSSQIIADAQRQMTEAQRRILTILKDLTSYHRDSYKLAVRKEILSGIDVPLSIPESDVDRIVGVARKAFGAGGASLPFYQELVREVIVEDLTPGGAAAREAILGGLAVKAKKSKKQEKTSLKPTLLEAVRIAGSASRHLESALEKLNANSLIYEEQKSKSGGPIKRWLYRIIYGEKRERIYDVEFVDIATSVSRTEQLDFDKFLEEAVGVARVLNAVSNKMSPRYSRLEGASDEDIYNALEKLIIQTQKIQRTLPAVYDFLSSELARELRGKLRGIKLEINGIQNAVVKANQKRHEYVSRKEEEDQLKRLGIGTSPSQS